MLRKFLSVVSVALLFCSSTVPLAALADGRDSAGNGPTTITPIKHLVIIFDENNSFDHYFGTYPDAKNLVGETPFHAAAG